MQDFWKNLKMFLWLSVLTGILYPCLITGIAYLTMPAKAGGSLVISHGKIVGSELIAQKIVGEGYFWPRPSAIDYKPLPSGGSNLGPTSAALKKAVDERKAALIQTHHLQANAAIPSDLLFASASGLDPHISLPAAYFQISRVLQARGIEPEAGRAAVKKMIENAASGRSLGFIGERYVNVLLLNLALDEHAPKLTPLHP